MSMSALVDVDQFATGSNQQDCWVFERGWWNA